MAQLQATTSKKAKAKKCYGGYVYDFDKLSTNGLLQYWRCEKSRTNALRCKGRLHTDMAGGCTVLGAHNHVANPARKEILDAVENMRQRAQHTNENTHQVVQQGTVGLSEAARGQLSAPPVLKRIVQKKRKREHHAPPAPGNLNELVIPHDWTQYERIPGQPEPFLMHDSGQGPDRILVFSTQNNLQLLQRCTQWYADGTFKVTPPLFTQMYTIHGEQFGGVHPLVYALLPDKREITYDRLLAALQQLMPNLNPQRVLTDFERAAINAIQKAFPNAETSGCFFHMSQAIWRKIQEVGLAQLYETNSDFNLMMRHIPAVAFVPLANVDEYYDLAMLALENFPGLTNVQRQAVRDLGDYVEHTYIGSQDRRFRFRPPLFDRQLWNVYDASVNGLARTNNATEAWHRALGDTFNMHHPTIWRFIQGLRKEQQHRDVVIEGLIAGNQVAPPRRRYRDHNLRILAIIRDFPNRLQMVYLRGIAHNMSF